MSENFLGPEVGKKGVCQRDRGKPGGGPAEGADGKLLASEFLVLEMQP